MPSDTHQHCWHTPNAKNYCCTCQGIQPGDRIVYSTYPGEVLSVHGHRYMVGLDNGEVHFARESELVKHDEMPEDVIRKGRD